MNILLATYNFYPYRFGGSEVYVYSLAKYLLSIGIYPTVVAAMPPEQKIMNEEVIYKDENIEINQYLYDGIEVWSAKYYSIEIEEIYSKKSLKHKRSWKQFFKGKKKFDLLHIHGFTTTIGLDLFETIKENYPLIKVFISYHTPISCTKGTLIFANTKHECPYKIGVTNCTACLISERLNLPFKVSKAISYVLPNYKMPQLPAYASLKSLVNDSVKSFKELDKITDRWIVYSKGIQNHLIRNDIDYNKIYQIRHGISNLFLKSDLTLKSNDYSIFLFNGRLEKLKGFHTLLKAWLKIPESKERVLWITGVPKSDNADIRKLIEHALLRKDIKFLGIKTQLELLDIYKQSHCLIIPSEWIEIGPLVFHEAISAGCNIIHSNIGGCAELSNHYKNESNPFEAGNVKSLVQSIIKFKYIRNTPQPILSAEDHNKLIIAQYSQVYGNVV